LRLALLPLAALLAGLLAACATPTTPTTPAIDTPAAWQRGSGLPAAATPERWWAMLGDPTLDGLIDEALRGAPDLLTAQTRVREARARVAVAAAARGSSVTGSATTSRARSNGSNSSLFDLGLDASWEADLFGRLRSGADAAALDLSAVQAGLAGTRLSLQAEVASQYLDWRSARERLALTRDNLARQQETRQIAEWRQQAGLASSLDVEQARSSTGQTRAQLAALEDNQAQAQLALELLLGRAPGALDTPLAQATAALRTPAPAGLALPADALRQRPDVAAAARQWQAEAARTGQAQAATRPRLTLSGSIGLQATRIGSLQDGVVGSVAAGLLAPLFDGGSLRAQVDAQTAVQDRYAVAYRQTVTTALSEVEAALSEVAAQRRQADALTDAAEAARNAALLARQRYDSGLVDFRTVLDAERSALTLDDSLATTRHLALKAWVRLFKALGGGDTAPPDSAD
jgi:outer membrane protein, multidrug efflux system